MNGTKKVKTFNCVLKSITGIKVIYLVLIMAFMLNAGCGGGGGGSSSGGGGVTPTPVNNDPAVEVSEGNTALKNGDTALAQSYFTNAIKAAESASLTNTEVYMQACVGLAISYSASLSVNVNNAIEYLDKAGFSDTAKQYTNNSLDTKVTDAEVRGYKSFLHYFRNLSSDPSLGKTNFDILKTQNGSVSDTAANSKLMEKTIDELFVNY